MNYYNHYPAHYLAKTLLLSMEQDGAYRRLMDWYYSEEKAIPHDKRYVIARSQKKTEKNAVDFVLENFFFRQGNEWVHDRVEKELGKASPKIEAARANGLKGGRPRKEKPSGFPGKNPMGFHNETQTEPSSKAPQTPNPNTSVESTEASTQVSTGTEAGRACVLMRQAGCGHTNPGHVDLQAAISEGVTAEVLRDTAVEAIGKGIGKPFTWAIATARARHAAGPSPVVTGQARAGPRAAEGKTMGALKTLEGMKSGNERERNKLDSGRILDGIPEAANARIGGPAGG